MSKQLDFLLGHYMVGLLALALVGLTIMGVGDIQRVSYIGILLCMAGFFRQPGKAVLACRKGRFIYPQKIHNPPFSARQGCDDKFLLYDTVRWIANLDMDYRLALRFDFPMPTRLILYAY